MSRPKQSPDAGRPPVAAGVALTQMRRRVQWGRAGVWAALAAGPLALAVAALQPSTTVAAPGVAAQRPVQPAAVADPAGYVAEFVDAWLRSSEDADSAAGRRAQSMAPGVPLPSLEEDAQAPRRVTPVRSVPRGGGQWSVTVAAQYADAVRYFAVPALVSASGDSFAVTAAPALVAAPALYRVPVSAFRVTVPEGPLTQTAKEFLLAYLAGRGEVGRYLAPGVEVAAVSPAAAQDVEVQEVAAREETAAEGGVPRDGTRVHTLVQVEADGAAGRWPLAYELTLAARGGRWEIAALSSGSGGER
ncbi:conjugal transfer protein [Streptomyces sp. NPDC050732]|uniref:conjugal transfer protein n=1 Tax=Streptomyces sp. NPDC050732 TaxID=3154632 RepID=UPI003412CED6